MIEQKFQALSAQPNMGRGRDELAESLRSLPVGRYVIFYRPIAGGVEIIRVLHGSRDLDNVFHCEEQPHLRCAARYSGFSPGAFFPLINRVFCFAFLLEICEAHA
jgi:toxin ParE1/3/4